MLEKSLDFSKNFAIVIRNFIFNFVHLWFDNHRAVVVLLVMEVVVVMVVVT